MNGNERVVIMTAIILDRTFFISKVKLRYLLRATIFT